MKVLSPPALLQGLNKVLLDKLRLRLMLNQLKMKNKEELIATFNESVIACNNCHKLSQHSFIEITIPESPALDNQQYAPISNNTPF